MAAGVLSAAALLHVAAAAAAALVPETADLSTLVVTEEVPDRLTLSVSPEALPTATYVLDKQKIESLPYARATDLLRSTPGITFGSSSPGGDIGDDISIRGFSSYHGADVAVYVDGVPVNWPHSPMRHGMTDFNWLTPDVVERIEIIKGPFSAEYGNFNLSGAVNIITRTTEKTSVGIEIGNYGNYRATGVYGRAMGKVTPFLAYEYLDREGYRDNNDFQRVSAFNKFTFPVADGHWSLRFSAAKRENKSAGFLFVDEVRSGLFSRTDAHPDALVNPDHGENDNLAFVANYLPSDANGTAATLYAGHDRVLLVDTAFGPPTMYSEGERNYAGWRVSRALRWGERALVTVGTDGQFDSAEAVSGDADGAGGLDRETLSRDEETDSRVAGVFAQGQVRLTDTFKLIGGARFDYMYADVTNKLFPNSGDASQTFVSPKIGLVWMPIRELELFANTGKGFRSPASTELAPNRAGAQFNGSLEPAELVSSDVGFTARLNSVEFTAAYFTTKTKRELRRDPENPVNVINIGETERDGYELIADWRVMDNLSISLSHTDVDTRIVGPGVTPGQDRVITVPEYVQTLNASWHTTVMAGLPLAADLYVQRIGPRPLTSDGSVKAEVQTTYGAKAQLTRGQWSGFLETVYAPDKYSSDFVFDLGGIVYSPRPVVTVLTGIKYLFD